MEQFSTNEINYTRYRRAKNTLRLNNYTPYNTLQRPSMKHQRNISERASIKKKVEKEISTYIQISEIFFPIVSDLSVRQAHPSVIRFQRWITI